MDVEKLARILKKLVTVTFCCNLLALLLVPFFVEQRFRIDFLGIARTFEYDWEDGMAIFFDMPYYQVWQQPYTAVLTVFLWACGVCTAVILWQGRRVLDTVLRGETFTRGNAANMGRAAVCCFLISGAALLRTVWGLFHYGSIGPLFTYNTLFIPVFFMAGLLCLILSALVRQAAELKEENDLTI